VKTIEAVRQEHYLPLPEPFEPVCRNLSFSFTLHFLAIKMLLANNQMVHRELLLPWAPFPLADLISGPPVRIGKTI
jgi:hypothetical protein